jgi:hypothetical protein
MATVALIETGPAGMFYYSGIAFNRTQFPGWVNGALFIARFIDKNDAEAGADQPYGKTVTIVTGKTNKEEVGTEMAPDARALLMERLRPNKSQSSTLPS